jgi:hypothetical protein
MITFENLQDAEQVSSEFIRAWAWATRAVLGFHNMTESCFGQTVRVTDLSDDGWEGFYEPYPNGRNTAIVVPRISLHKGNSSEAMATAIVHEFIHAMCGDFGEGTDEKCTSTLTAKLKPEVKVLADQLLDGTYRRAAFIAHTKLSYRNAEGEEDYYDRAQDDEVGVTDKYQGKGE